MHLDAKFGALVLHADVLDAKGHVEVAEGGDVLEEHLHVEVREELHVREMERGVVSA